MAEEYTVSEEELILDQMLVAFGAGVGFMRVSRQTVGAFRKTHEGIAREIISEGAWAEDGVHLLEHVRAVGRLAANLAVNRGDVGVTEGDLNGAFDNVSRTSRTRWCRSSELAQ